MSSRLSQSTRTYRLCPMTNYPRDLHKGLNTSTFTLLQLLAGSRRNSKCSYTLKFVQKLNGFKTIKNSNDTPKHLNMNSPIIQSTWLTSIAPNGARHKLGANNHQDRGSVFTYDLPPTWPETTNLPSAARKTCDKNGETKAKPTRDAKLLRTCPVAQNILLHGSSRKF